MDTERKTITKDEAFMVIYDFLKRNRILGNFVNESYRYQNKCGHFGEVKRITADVTKKIILSNISLYCDKSHNRGKFDEIFISYNGSFVWDSTNEGSVFWRKFLDNKWKWNVYDRYGTRLVYIV